MEIVGELFDKHSIYGWICCGVYIGLALWGQYDCILFGFLPKGRIFWFFASTVYSDGTGCRFSGGSTIYPIIIQVFRWQVVNMIRFDRAVSV